MAILSGLVLAERKVPVAVPLADPSNAVLGAVVKLNGQGSYDPQAQLPRMSDDSTTSAGTDSVTIPSAALSQDDVGRYLKLTGTDAGEFIIYEVSGNDAKVVVAENGAGVSFVGGANTSWTIFDRLSFAWSFISVPIGSGVRQENLRLLDTDASLVSFSPDIVGEYVMQLIVSNGVFSSEPVETRVSVRAMMVPHGRGLVPDGKFIWNYIRDVWSQVDGREWFETLWSALIQIAGSETLKLYQNDFAKSIRDIQDQYQRRWLSYEPKLALVEDDLSFFLGNHCAGNSASTKQVGTTGQAILVCTDDVPAEWQASHAYSLGDVVHPTSGNEDLGYYFRCTVAGLSGATEPDWVREFGEVTVDNAARWELVSLTKEMVIVQGTVFPNFVGETIDITYDSLQPNNVRSFRVHSINAAKNGYRLDTSTPPPDPIPGRVGAAVSATFPFQSTTWTASAQVGDVFHFKAGPNAGFYRVVEVDGGTCRVHKAPPSFSDVTTLLTHSPNLYRPVGYEVVEQDDVLTNAVAVPYEATANDASVLAPGRILTVGGHAHTILRTTVDASQMVPVTVLVTEKRDVLAGLVGQNWRAPHTLVSESQDFAALGVSTGDLLVFTITDQSTQMSADIVTQVIGVDGKRLGFVLTDELPTPGSVPSIPDKTYEALADGLGISTLSRNQAQVLGFSGEALVLKQILETGVFKRAYWNKELTPESDIVVGSRTFRIHPSAIYRNKMIPVDETLRSIPLLQEWIQQPELSTHDGKIFQKVRGKEIELDHLPVSLVENTDYIIDSEDAFDGLMKFDTGTDIIYVEGANFQDRGILPGDKFIIDTPASLTGTYRVTRVLDEDRILLSKQVPLYALGPTVTARVRIERQREGHFLRFAPGVFTAKSPAPKRLWGEVSFFDNSQYIEDNFGILVALTKEDVDAVSKDMNYRQAVAGLMFAYTKGSAIDKVRLGAQILLGLPFAEHKGIIRSIEENFRLDQDGNAIEGRFLVEDLSQDGVPQGTMRVYTFPIDAESELSGVETNPATERPYTAGDVVELFAILAKGVEVFDYLSKPEWPVSDIGRIQQTHTVRMLANDDIFSIKELSLISPFLKKITPHYVHAIITIASEFADTVSAFDLVDLTLSNRSNPFVDNPYFSLASPLIFDGKLITGNRFAWWDGGLYWVRKTGKDAETTALVGSPGDPQTISILSGGIETPSAGEGPVTRAGDKILIVKGDNQGIYNIASNTDTTVVVDDCPEYGFQPATDNMYALLRPVTGELRSGELSSTADVATMEVGLQADGVAPGDLLVIDRGAGAYSRHRAVRVGPHADAPALAAGEMQVTPEIGTLATRPYRVYREVLVEAPYHEGATLESTGTAYNAMSDILLQALLEPGDQLEVNGGAFERLTVVDPFRNVYSPVLPADTYDVKVCKRGHTSSTPVGFNHLDLGPVEEVDIALQGSTANTTSGSEEVSFGEVADPAANGMRPTDFLAILAGADSTVDVGYGPGLYPIVEVTTALVKVAANLTATGAFAWKVIRRR